MHSLRGCALFAAVLWPLAAWAAAGDEPSDAPPAAASAAVTSAAADPSDPADVEFFEKKVRPLLAARCHQCHGQAKQKGNLRLDSRAAVLKGGDTAPAVVPGKPDESLLVDAIRYGETYQMPPKSQLPADEIATLVEWVRRGAPWGHQAAAAGESARPAAAFDLQARAGHWSFQPLAAAEPPVPAQGDWAATPIDDFILSGLEAARLAPAAPADKLALLRRVTYDVTGLPPTRAEIEAFAADESPIAYERVVDRLLASPRYGERWARHWLDLVRYAETYGHEFDFDIPNAYCYRDYVIRAFNADVPYDQFVVEHLAGDLLDEPRRNPSEGFNESIIATGFFFLGEAKHSPVDVRQDEADRIDNQIDVLAKTFLALTVSCARCHDHKFDAISTKDYYALAGYLQSSRYQQAFIDSDEATAPLVTELKQVSEERQRLVADFARWSLTQELTRLADKMLQGGGASAGPWAEYLRDKALAQPDDVFHAWALLDAPPRSADAGAGTSFAERRAGWPPSSRRLRRIPRRAITRCSPTSPAAATATGRRPARRLARRR